MSILIACPHIVSLDFHIIVTDIMICGSVSDNEPKMKIKKIATS